MATDWIADVKKYAKHPDERAVAGIVRYCGPVLANRDAALISFTDKDELKRVREGFLKEKLGLKKPDAELDKAITAVGEKMKKDRTRNRVTAYYLLAEHFGKLPSLN